MDQTSERNETNPDSETRAFRPVALFYAAPKFLVGGISLSGMRA